MTLYEINKSIEAILEDVVDPETGEIIEGDLFEAYEALQMDWAEKVDNIACFIKDLKAEAAAIREEEKALAARRRSAESKGERLSQYLEFCLHGEKFSSPRASVSYRRACKVVVDEAHLFEIPEQYLRYKDPEVDKTAVKKALTAGEAVPGCNLVESTSMIIK